MIVITDRLLTNVCATVTVVDVTLIGVLGNYVQDRPMTEAAVMQWFAVHPFTRTVTVMFVTAIVMKVKQDYVEYQKALAANPDTAYDIWAMVRQCGWGTLTVGVMAVVPTLIAEVFKVLGGGVLP